MNQLLRLGRYLWAPVLALSVAGCQPDHNPNIPEEAEGWAPVYSKEAYVIKSTTPRPIETGGKIYIKGNLLFQVEQNKGIHVLDVSHPDNPQKLTFIACEGAQEMAARGNYLYTNNLNDLVILDIHDVANVTVANRVTSAFHMLNQGYPPEFGYFECVDTTKGTVVGWEKKTLKRPECIR